MTPTPKKDRTLTLERVKTLHGTTPARSDEAKLKKLTSWKHWRRQGLTKQAVEKRLKTDLRLVRKWAAELGFDLGKDAV